MLRSLDAETAYLMDTQRRLVRLGVIAAVLAALAGWLIAERVTRPVQRLVRGAEEMERGNYEYPLEVQHRDEIGEAKERLPAALKTRTLHRARMSSDGLHPQARHHLVIGGFEFQLPARL